MSPALPIAALLMRIVASFPPGPSPEASVWFDGDDRNTTCELVAGAEKDRGTWHEEWTCFTWDPKCQTDGECEGSEEAIGGFERGADKGKPYRIIIPQRPTAIFK